MTTETKHTPAPWELRIIKDYIRNCHIAAITGQYSVAQANARLIAAAPELLAALEWCELVYGKDWPENASIRDTIRKAKGI